MTRRRRRGGGLLDALACLALVGVLLAGAAGLTGKALRRQRAPAAARLAASDVRRLRGDAVAAGKFLGIRFTRTAAGDWMATFVEDGDGDGIRTEDLRRGIDRVKEGPHRLRERWGVQPGYARGLRGLRSPPPDSAPLAHLNDPVRFGASDIASCSPRGTITSGTIYLSDGAERQLAVVVAGSSARVRIWEYLLDREEWVLR